MHGTYSKSTYDNLQYRLAYYKDCS